jgi:hypothetical protein
MSLFRCFSRQTKESLARAPVFHRTASSEAEEVFPVRMVDRGYADGAWWCSHCQLETHIHVTQGDHPLGQFKCHRCKHVICRSCQVTNIVQMYPITEMGFMLVPKFDSPNIPYGHICPGCGTTHRATKDTRKRNKQPQLEPDSAYVCISFCGRKCDCGEVSDPDWVRFMIGSNRDWQRDPLHYYKFHLEQRLEQSMAYSKGQSASARPGMRWAATAPLPRRLSGHSCGTRHTLLRAGTHVVPGNGLAKDIPMQRPSRMLSGPQAV